MARAWWTAVGRKAVGAVSVLALTFWSGLSLGQVPTASSDVPFTEVYVELLARGSAAASVAARQWADVFQQLNVPVRIRPPILDDKPEVKEQRFGRIRRVTAIGELDRTGKITFPDHTFTLQEVDRLTEWIRELRTYGALGSPEGKPLFGLSRAQFHDLLLALSERVEAAPAGKPLREALAALPLPKTYPLRFSVSAERWLEQHGEGESSQPVEGLAVGTALAAVLNEFGLGFRPWRTPAGAVELRVEPLDEEHDHWPVGWDVPPETPRLKLSRELFRLRPVQLQDVPLTELLQRISTQADVPILLDRHRIEKEGLDLDQIRVTVAGRQMTWSSLLRTATVPHKLNRVFRLDETGRLLVWVTTLQHTLRATPRYLPK